jgi:hypothetical protein
VTIAYYAIGSGLPLIHMSPMPFTYLELEWKIDAFREAYENAARASTFIRYDAARICSLSGAGEILVSDVVRGMARTSAGVMFEDRGDQEMKGVGEPVRVYAVRESDDG